MDHEARLLQRLTDALGKRHRKDAIAMQADGVTAQWNDAAVQGRNLTGFYHGQCLGDGSLHIRDQCATAG